MWTKESLKSCLGKKVYIPIRNDYGTIIAVDTLTIENNFETEPFAIEYETYNDTGKLTLNESIDHEVKGSRYRLLLNFKIDMNKLESTNWDWFFPEQIEFLDLDVKIKYHNQNMPKLFWEENKRIDLRIYKVYFFQPQTKEKIEKQWIDGRMNLQANTNYFFDLGVSLELPAGYEAEITPRSGTYAKHGLILTNSPGIIDNDYKGDNDNWKALCYCTFDTTIEQFERLFQFKIVKNMHKINFKEVDLLGNANRGGYGSTGRK
jgi:dUTP pyrophosphatase